MLHEKVFKTIQTQNLIQPNDRIGVAVSGGQDSMTLLHILMDYAKIHQNPLVCLHVEHGIRGKSSLHDQDFVERFCKMHRIPYIASHVATPEFAKRNRMSTEQAARFLRYKEFEKMAQAENLQVIALAHHMDDRAETILFNILRGAGLQGAAGIQYRRGIFIRPLLNIPKKDIENYVKENDIRYVTDESNADTTYTRNFLRKEIFPLLKQKFGNPVKALCRFGDICKAASPEEEDTPQTLQNFKQTLQKENIRLAIPIVELEDNGAQRLHDALVKANLATDISQTNILDMMNLLQKQSGSMVHLAHNLAALREFDMLYILEQPREEQSETQEIPIVDIWQLRQLQYKDFTLTAQLLKKQEVENFEDALYLDADVLKKILQSDNVLLRQRRTGDTFTPFGGKKKSLKKWMIDKKISSFMRGMPILARKSEVLVVTGGEIADCLKVQENTENILKITLWRNK